MKKFLLVAILVLTGFITESVRAQCTYSICLRDTYGDGWNGGSITVLVNGSPVLANQTLSSGYGPVCYNFTVNQGDVITVNYTGGSWTFENYYTVYNAAGGGGSVIFASTQGSTPNASQSITNPCTTGGGGGTPPGGTTCNYSICLYDTFGDGWNGGSVSVVIGGTTVLSNVTLASGSGPACFNFTVQQGQSIVVNYSGGSWTSENYYTVFNGSNGSGTAQYSSPIYTTPAGTTSVTNNCGGTTGGGTGPGGCIGGQNNNCATADPFCTGTAYNYCNTTGVPSMGTYGCLFTTPNPMWMYLNVQTGGNIDIQIQQFTAAGVGVDVDFAMYGPFTSLAAACASITPSSPQIDCSYSTAYTEYANITGAVAGQFYMLLITNYSNQLGYIQFQQTGGSGATNCNIVLPCSVTAAPTNVTCPGGTNGSVTLNFSGTPNYTVSVVNSGGTTVASTTTASATQTFNNLPAGSYTVNLTASGGCTNTTTFNIAAPNPIVITPTPTHVTCNGGTNGSISVTASGGTAGYNVSWSGPSSGNPAGTEIAASGGTYNITGLATGTYTVTITDANNCTQTSSVTINQPTLITATPTPTAVSCVGGNNGTIAVVASGGTAGYNVSWTGPSTGNPAGTEIAASGGNYTITGLVAGTYTVTVTDANGCTRTVSSTVNPGVTVNANITPVAAQCLNGNSFNFSGSTSTISSGTITSYSWNFGNGNTGTGVNATQSYAAAGTYTVTLTASNGTCTNTETLNITVNPNPTATLTVTPPACNGQNGTITVNPSGGSTFSYAWNPPAGQTSQTVSVPAGGPYQVTVTNNFGCTTTVSASMTQPTPVVVGGVPTAVTCNGGNNGSILVTASGGTAGYNISWSGPSSGNPAGTEIAASGGNYSITGLTAGTYTVTATGVGGCTATASVTVTQPTPVTATISSSTNITCFGGNNGSATVTASGGTAPYTYSWSPSGGTGATASGLTAGTYTVTVTGVGGCTQTASVTITQPTQVTAAISSSTNVTCNGGANGSATVTPAGGVAPYTYSWSPSGGTGATASGLAAGAYTVTVTSVGGCTATASVNITQPPVLTATMGAPTHVSCNGGNNGAVSVTAGGGVAPYTYSWSPAPGAGQGTASVSSLTAGTYTVTVTGVGGCTATASVTINQPPVLTATISASTNVTCNGGNNGSATVTAGGGTAPYTYNWSPSGGTGATASGLTAGTYTVTVTSVGGCTATTSVTITQPTAVTASISASSNVSCNGGNNGSATVTPAGGTAPYTFNWSPSGGTAATASGLTAGTYTVTVTATGGCTTTTSVTITQPTALTATMGAPTNVSCNGGNNGSVSVNVSGGTAPYSYNWSPAPGAGQGTAAVSSLTAGAYTVTITDALGCTTSANATITQPPVLTATMGAPTHVSCNGGNNGSATVTPAGGTAPYTFSWSPSGGTAATATGLAAGTYTVTVTGVGGCTATASVTINQPAALSSSITASTNVSCNGGNNGSATVTPVGGTAPYTFSWSPSGGTAATASSLTAGSYTVTVTDAGGCTTTSTITITQPAALVATMNAPTHVSCNGGNNGAVSVNVSGGVTNYTYNWSPAPGAGQGTAAITSLTAGAYTVTVTDANGCTQTASATITQPAVLTANISASSNVSCNGGTNGSATVTAGGGTAGYSYAWSPSGGTGATAASLSAGTYTVTVTDNNGCTASTSVNITQPTAITLNTSSVNTNCGASTGSATVVAAGGAGGYSYSWNTAPVQTGATATGLAAGTYVVTVTDASGCTATASQGVNNNAAPTIAEVMVSHVNVSCNGGNNGAAEVSVAGGAAPLSVSWSPSGGTNTTATGLTAGTYTVTVTDDNACQASVNIIITQPPVLTATAATTTNVSCNGGNNGAVSVTAGGGAGGFTYSWAPSGGTGATASGLTAGTYTVTVTDANSCTITASTTVTQPAALTATMGAPTMISCNGANNGSATVTGGGGTAPYSYNWSPAPGGGQGTASVNGLSAQGYTVTITDALGCTATASVTITEPAALTATMGAPTDVSCNGGNNGSLTVTAGGGTIGYTYSWLPSGGTAATANGLTAGNYTVTITDANGCTATASGTISQPSLLTSVMGAPTHVTCNGANNGSATVAVNGGTTNYTYVWAPAPGSGQGTASAGNMAAGAYTVTVTDANGCTTASSVTINQPTVLTAVMGAPTMVSCNGGNNGAAAVAAGGGTTPYSFNWSPAPGAGQGTNSASSLTAGSYTVTVTDDQGCTATASATITEPALLTLGSSSTNATCGASNGSATVTIAGGTSNYTISWNTTPVQNAATATGLPAGSYTASVTDANGCTASIVVNVVNDAAPTITEIGGSHIDVSCFGGNNGSAEVAVAGGTAPLTISWSPSGGNAATASGLTAGNYTVTVTDFNGCSASTNITITEPVQLVSVMGAPTMVSCNGGNNGAVSVSVNGGVAPYAFNWTPAPGAGQGTAAISSLTAGTYDVTVTDFNGCTNLLSVTITEPSAISAALSTTAVSCNGGNDGTATLTIGGGVPAYSVNWSPAPGTGQGTNSVTGLSAGLYTAVVTDNNGCTFTAFPTITEPALLVATATGVDAHCGQADGSASVSSVGGTGAVTFSWNTTPVQSGSIASSITAGTYTVTATDANGCTSTSSVTINDLAGPTATSVVNSNVTGAGLCNGSATATPADGTAPYSVVWDNGNTNMTAADLCAGTNCATITDAAGCTTITCVTITEPAALTVSLTPTDLNCFNICIGQVNSIVSGGVGPYTYSWSNGATGTNLLNVCAGNYTVTVTDFNGNTATASATVNQPSDIVMNSATSTPTLCNGSCDGTVSANASGGTGALTYTWTGGLVGSTINGLCAGTYNLLVTDANGCSEPASVTVTSPTALNAVTSTTNANCGNADGSASVTAGGGTSPYSYSWSSGSTTDTQSGAAAGNYSVTITDNNGCTLTASATVGNNPAGTVAVNMVSPVMCNGAANGSAIGVVTGGAAPYTYSWNTTPVQTTATAINLGPGTYTLTVTDDNGCIITESISFTEPPALQVSFNSLDVTCHGGSNGAFQAVITGGSPAYVINWVNSGGTPIGTTPAQLNVPADTYTVSILDDNGCTVSGSVTINEPPVYAVVISTVDVKCFNACDGSVSATVSGGTPPYTYAWNDALSQTTSTAAFLCDGNYSVDISDNNGCTLTANATITQPDELVGTPTAVDAHCQQNDGSGCVTFTGGTAPYTQTWLFNGANTTCQNNLFAGTYLVAVVDQNQCRDTAVVQVNDIAGPTAVIIAQNDVTCFGLSDGSATVNMVGGTGIFTVQWDANTGNQTTPTASNLAAGNYAVTITDAAGCAASTNVAIQQPTQIVYIPTAVDPSCFSFCDGSVSLAAVGGVLPYTYDWRDGANAQIGTGTSVTGLCDGSYTLVFADANGCTSIIPYTLTQPVQVTGTISSTNNSCFNACDGTATLVANTGIAPFSYQWSSVPAQTTSTATGLCAGSYTVTLTDNSGCTNTYNTTINEPTLLTASIPLSGNVSCAGFCNGFAEATAAGGTAPYQFSWSNNTFSQVNQNLCIGTYTVTVTDANGCTATASVTIIEPNALTLNVTGTDNTCYQSCDGTANASISGGTAPYAIQWDNATFSTTPAISGLCAATYNVVVTDANGCFLNGSVQINQPAILDFAATITNNAFCGQSNGSICAFVIGGVPPYSYQYDDPAGQNTSCAFNLGSGCYNLVITDGNGCIKDSLLCINDIPGPTLGIAASTDVTCNGFADGSIDVSTVGGTAPFVYTWLDGSGNPIAAYNNMTSVGTLSGGTYAISVTDSANCVSNVTQFIFEPNALFAAVTASTQPSCFSFCDATATVSVSGGMVPYSYAWTSGSSANAAANTGLCAGAHSVLVTDNNGCTITANTTIGEPTQLVVNTSVLENVSCFGYCDGLITLSVSGATLPYNYTWTNGVSTGPQANALCADSYTTTVVDNNGCTVVVNNVVTEPDQLLATISTTYATCSQCNGTASAAVVGGTTPYNYSWTNGANPSSANNMGICAGNTSVTVTDANGCVYNTNATIIDLAGPQITNMTFTQPSCTGFSNGTATVTTMGGSAPLSYLWDNGQTAATATGLVAGTYCLVVADTNGCTAANCITVTEPSPLGAVGDLEVTICYGDSTQLWASGTGGTPPYTINWATAGLSGPGPIMVEPTVTTTYCFTVTDDRGCISPQDCITITVNPPLDQDVSPSIAICNGSSTTLTSQAVGGNGGPYSFTWTDEFGNTIPDTEAGNNSTVNVDPTVDTWYYVTVDDGCSIPHTDSVQVTINATPIVFLNAVDTAGCAPFTAQFILNTDIGVNFSYDFNCDGVADYTGIVPNATFTYPNPGTYDVCVTVTSPLGCVTTVSQSQMIDVYPVPVAEFITTPSVTTILNPTIAITDASTGSPVSYQWDFGDGSTMTGAPEVNVPVNMHGGNTFGTYNNPTHTYSDTGYFDIHLIVTNEFGCTDDVTYQIYIEGDYIFFAPNSFTPNGDGKNDIFLPVGIMIGGDEYEMLIFNRWGELIFESRNPDTGWDGTHKGVPAKQDVYVWKVKAFDHKGVQHDYIGHVTLLR